MKSEDAAKTPHYTGRIAARGRGERPWGRCAGMVTATRAAASSQYSERIQGPVL